MLCEKNILREAGKRKTDGGGETLGGEELETETNRARKEERKEETNTKAENTVQSQPFLCTNKNAAEELKSEVLCSVLREGGREMVHLRFRPPFTQFYIVQDHNCIFCGVAFHLANCNNFITGKQMNDSGRFLGWCFNGSLFNSKQNHLQLRRSKRAQIPTASFPLCQLGTPSHCSDFYFPQLTLND